MKKGDKRYKPEAIWNRTDIFERSTILGEEMRMNGKFGGSTEMIRDELAGFTDFKAGKYRCL